VVFVMLTCHQLVSVIMFAVVVSGPIDAPPADGSGLWAEQHSTVSQMTLLSSFLQEQQSMNG